VPTAKPGKFVDRFTISMFRHAPEFVERHRHLFFEVDDPDEGKTLAIYLAEKGYQRKGMLAAFYSEFENDRLYFDLASVRRAIMLLDVPVEYYQWIDQFMTDFVDNFKEGESVFYASW
jgi:hypothetical protein